MLLKFLKNFSLIVFSTFLLCCSSNSSSDIRDIIPPINLIAGVTDSVLVSDLFYSEDYNLAFKNHPDIDLQYNQNSGYLFLTPGEDFQGMTIIEFEKGGEKYHIAVKSKRLKYYKFTFKSSRNFNNVNLFGTFNGWNRQTHPMIYDDKSGIYEIEIPLDPGRYQYKFFADREEILDPANPVNVSNGMGGFNSVMDVAETQMDKSYPHVAGKNISNDIVKLSFIYESPNLRETVSYDNLIPLLDNRKIEKENIKFEGNKIEISFERGELPGEKILRLAVDQYGQSTNLQSVVLFEGEPAGKSDLHFSWYDGIIYTLMIDRFNDGDESINNPVVHDSISPKANYHGGDLQGVIHKLNEGYFDSLGINVLWISPVYDSPNEAFKEYPPPHRWFSGYHGYWPIDPERVEEKFGTMAHVKELVNTAHAHGIKVLLDFVSNHVHEQHPYFKQHRDWFGVLELPDGRRNLRFWDEFRLTTWFEPYMPSFDYLGSSEALKAMTDNAVWWLKETGADGFRHDAVKHVPNLFWRSLTQKLKKEIEIPGNKIVYQIGETFGSYDLISSYVNNGQLNAQFNFNLYDQALPTFLDPNISFETLNSEMQKTFSVYGNLHVMGNIMDSHDKNRFMAYTDGDLDVTQWSAAEVGWNNPPQVDNPESYKKLVLYMAYMNTIPGLPVIYYGSEFGMTGASDPDNRRMMRFNEELTSDERKTLNEVRKIINLRKDHSALRYGDFLTLHADENEFAYLRSDMNERILIVLNKSKENRELELQLPKYYGANNIFDLVNQHITPIRRGKVNIEIPAEGWNIYELKE